MYRPRSEVLEVITQGPKTKPILEYEAPITYASSKKSSSTRKASSSTKKSDYHPGEDQWHTFNISGIKLHVYSAYYDDRNKGEEVIRMNGAIKGVATVRTKNVLKQESKKCFFFFFRVSPRRRIASLKRSTKATLSRQLYEWST